MRKKKKLTLSIIVPVFNEEKTVALILKTVSRLSLPGIVKDIVVVNDGSADGTAGVLKKIKIPGVRIFNHEKNKGKAAIRTAIPHTKGDFVIIQDADLEYDPMIIKNCWSLSFKAALTWFTVPGFAGCTAPSCFGTPSAISFLLW